MSELKVLETTEVLGQELKIYGDMENPLFLAKDVAGWIQHSNSNMMLQSVDDDEKVIKNVYTPGGSQETWFLTEDGLYEVLFSSRKQIAKRFKREVKNILKNIRKHGSHKPMTTIEFMELQMQAIKETDAKIEAVDKDLQDFKEDLPLLAVECDKITYAVRKAGVEWLGGKDSNAYKDRSLRNKLYSDLHREVRRQFGVTTYKAIKRNQTDKVLAIINSYEPPIVLTEQIIDCNKQLSLVAG